MRHTDTPWICHSGMIWKGGPNVYPKGTESGIPIARMDREPDNGTMPAERDANAHFIATACNSFDAMLEACQDALSFIDDSESPHSGRSIDLARKLEQVITKARILLDTPEPEKSRRYKGKHVYTIRAEDIQNPLNTELAFYIKPSRLLDTMGRLLPCDIGKQVFEMPSGHYQVENDEQLAKRIEK